MRSVSDFDLDAPIIANHGLGGVVVRRPILDYQELIGSYQAAQLQKPVWYSLAYPFEARYVFGAIEIAVDVRNGKVFKVTAHAGYRGLLLGKLAVGMPIPEAMRRENRLYLDEAEGLLLIRGVEGVAIDVSFDDPLPSEIMDESIWAITVNAQEALSADGQAGRW